MPHMGRMGSINMYHVSNKKDTHVLDVSNCNSDDVKSDVLSCIKEKLNTFLHGGV